MDVKINVNSLMISWLVALTFLWLVVSWSKTEPTSPAVTKASSTLEAPAQPPKNPLGPQNTR